MRGWGLGGISAAAMSVFDKPYVSHYLMHGGPHRVCTLAFDVWEAYCHVQFTVCCLASLGALCCTAERATRLLSFGDDIVARIGNS